MFTIKKLFLYFASLFLCIGVVIFHATYSFFIRPIGRIDFSTSIDLKKAFDVYVVSNRDAYVPKEIRLDWWPDWMKNGKLYGRIYETDLGKAHIDIHVYKPCELTLRFLGNDALNSRGYRLNPKVTFSSIKINDREILERPKIVWHDNSFYYVFPVEPGLIKLDAHWRYPNDEEGL